MNSWDRKGLVIDLCPNLRMVTERGCVSMECWEKQLHLREEGTGAFTYVHGPQSLFDWDRVQTFLVPLLWSVLCGLESSPEE